MSNKTDLHYLTVQDLAKRCAQETELYFQHKSQDAIYCFELFRRAIRERDQLAWEMVYTQYNALVTGWVRQNPSFESSGEEVQYFVNGAFGKISGTLTPEKFGGFSDIGSLLRYLKMCVHSMIVDHNRLSEQAQLYPLDSALNEASADAPPEKQTMDRAYQQALWDWIDTRLHDEKERLVMKCIFILVLSPSVIYEHYPHKFSDVKEIYRIKQNVLARLSRDPDFKKLFGQDD
jgi:hypothetical protein